MRKFSGTTNEAGAPILSAKFWKEGVEIKGRCLRAYTTQAGECYELELNEPITVNGADVYPPSEGKIEGTHFSIGALKGFVMALNSAGLDRLERNDQITIRCDGSKKSGKGSDLVLFSVDVQRP